MRLIYLFMLLAAALASIGGRADDVIPSVPREEMSAYKNAFGKAISESRRVEGKKPEREDGERMGREERDRKDAFGDKVSHAASSFKDDIQRENKGDGPKAQKQRGQRSDEVGSNSGRGASDNAKRSTPYGRPKEKGGKGGGHGHGKGKKD